MTFKENCPDIRNSRVIDIINELNEFGCMVDVYDPWADKHEVKDEYGVDLVAKPGKNYSAVICAVAHDEFRKIDLNKMKKDKNAVVYDVKSILDKNKIDGRL
jgi:UDP-N-acetyl-D-galactosamine dehydrogenase